MVKKRLTKNGKLNNALSVNAVQKFLIGQPVYAKIAGYCPWPARVTYIFGCWCDVQFFGADER